MANMEEELKDSKDEPTIGKVGGAVGLVRSYHHGLPQHAHIHDHAKSAAVHHEPLIDLRDNYDRDLLYRFYEYVHSCMFLMPRCGEYMSTQSIFNRKE